jgi:Lon-like protease
VVYTSVVIAVISVITAALTFVPTPYQVLFPGPVSDVQSLIHPSPKPIRGALYLTTIYSDPANAAELAAVSVYLKFEANAAGIVPREEARPRNVPEPEYQKLLGRMMDESKSAAKVVALREAGFDVKLTGQGAQIQEISDQSKAKGILQPGDIVTVADGQPVTTSNDLVALIQAHKPGERMLFHVKRSAAELDLTVELSESPDEPGRARAGLIVLTHLYDYQLPREVDLQTKDVGGPSAGLMFALGVYNAVTPEDLTHGHKIAGTGTISTDGKVGAVGGVKYKSIAARRAGAELFIVPRENLGEARSTAGNMRVEGVDSFRQALDLLNTLPPAS